MSASNQPLGIHLSALQSPSWTCEHPHPALRAPALGRHPGNVSVEVGQLLLSAQPKNQDEVEDNGPRGLTKALNKWGAVD